MTRPILKLRDGFSTVSPTLREDVRTLQMELSRVGFPLYPDGLFGQATHNAVVAFQRNHGLNDDGIVSDSTWVMLLVANRPILRFLDGFDHVTPYLRDDVKELQALLRDKGFQQIIDGRFGHETEAVVKQFQSSKNLRSDGVVNKETWAALVEVPLLTTYLKDDQQLRLVTLRPHQLIQIQHGWSLTQKRIAELYNQLGGLIETIGRTLEVPVATTLGVFFVESGGRRHIVNRAIIRFENHQFYKHWGRFHEDQYNLFFQHGGQNAVEGQAWQQHRFRESVNESFRSFHGNQSLEYRALNLAKRIAGTDEPALLSISIGGPQILLSNYQLIGYENPQAMYNAFQQSEGAQVIGFFDFCKHVKAPQIGSLIRYLKTNDWQKFTRYYNGSGMVDVYSQRLQDTVLDARSIGI